MFGAESKMAKDSIDYDLDPEQRLLEVPRSVPTISACHDCEPGGMWKWRMVLPWILCFILATTLGVLFTIHNADRATDGYWRESEFSMLSIDRL
jgi:hypothetical protein